MTIEEMLKEFHKVLKTPDEDILRLPFGNSDPDEVINWIINLSDEDFSTLMKTPIVNQAKIYYKKFREN